MTRQRRIASALIVLGVGLVAALPFRRTLPDAPPPLPPFSAAAPVAGDRLMTGTPARLEQPVGLAAAPTEQATAEPITPLPPTAMAPAAELHAASTSVLPVASAAPLDRSPAAIDFQQAAPAPDWEQEPPSNYVIHNGDTLERIARRYLGDENRALEIFDLNREVLTNPHVLPLGAELVLPKR